MDKAATLKTTDKGLDQAAMMADTWAAIIELEGRRMAKKGRGHDSLNACQIAAAFRTFAKTLRRKGTKEVPSLAVLPGW